MFKKTMSLLLAAVLSAGLFASCSGNGAGNSSAPVSGDPSSCSEQQAEPVTLSFLFGDSVTVSYTHLDVYKRQGIHSILGFVCAKCLIGLRNVCL